MSWPVVLWSIGIFFSRVADVGLGTIRVQLIVRRRKALAALIGFFEISIYILVVSRVITEIGSNLGNIESWLNIIAYAGGFSVGTLVGVMLSEWMSRNAVQVTVIPREPWALVEQALREAGFALTRHSGMGREGQVQVLTSICSEHDLSRLAETVTRVDPNAFVYTQELAGLRGGYVYGVKSKL